MNVAALVQYLRGLQRANKKIDIVPFALAEAEVLEDCNETIDINNFAHEVGLRVLSSLE
ncbi:MAG TPA: hypothetical protein VKV04_02525 [Verrucomicrobiae bacterium]|nr:hypothetical protein [Verrucomicrobiae bacterium]